MALACGWRFHQTMPSAYMYFVEPFFHLKSGKNVQKTVIHCSGNYIPGGKAAVISRKPKMVLYSTPVASKLLRVVLAFFSLVYSLPVLPQESIAPEFPFCNNSDCNTERLLLGSCSRLRVGYES